jgi:hypothetical protein
MPKSTADHSSVKTSTKTVEKKAAERLTSCPTHSRERLAGAEYRERNGSDRIRGR